MKNVKLTELIDSIGTKTSASDLRITLEGVIAEISRNTEEVSVPVKTALLGEHPITADYTLCRLIKGCAVMDPLVQRNFMTALTAMLPLEVFKPNQELLLEYAKSQLSAKEAVNKREQQAFALARCKIFFLILTNSFTSENSIVDKLIKDIGGVLKSHPIGKPALALLINQASISIKNVFPKLIEEIFPYLVKGCPSSLLLALVFQRVFKKINLSVPPKLTSFLSSFTDAKLLLKTFDALHQEELLKPLEIRDLFFESLGEWMTSAKDARVSTLITLKKLIEKDKDKVEKKGMLVGRLLGFLGLLAFQFKTISQVDIIVKAAAALNLTNEFKALLKFALEQKLSKNLEVARLFKILELVILEKLKVEKGSLTFGNLLIGVLLDNNILAKQTFDFKDALFRASCTDEHATEFILSMETRLKIAMEDSLLLIKNTLQTFCLLLSYVKTPEAILSGYKLLFKLYNKADKVVGNLSSDLEYHSSEYLSNELRTYLYERLTQLLLRPDHQKLLGQLVEAWLKVNKADDVYENLIIGQKLLREGDNNMLIGILNLVVLFRDYKGPEQNVESMVFAQTSEDLALFGQKLLNSKNQLEEEDLEILTDVLITLFNISSSSLRSIIKHTFSAFASKMGSECLDLLVKAIFRDINDNNLEDSESEVENSSDANDAKSNIKESEFKNRVKDSTKAEEGESEEEESASEEEIQLEGVFI